MRAPAPGVSITGDGVEINFESTDIQTVARALLVDTLGLNVVVDARVQGPITIMSSRAIARKDVLPAFEGVLRMVNAALLQQGDLIKIVPTPEATGAGTSSTLGSGQPGFGVTIIPLRYTSAAALLKTTETFLGKPGAIRADPARNLLLVQGTQAERQAALDMAMSFDVEWLHNQSVGIYPLKATSPDTMMRELERLFETAEGGQGQGTVSFQTVNRMNAVIAVARSSKTLERVTQWINRLDREDLSGTTIRIYRLGHGNAPKIAKILNDIFVGRGTTTDSAVSQIAPGTSTAQSKLDAIAATPLSSTGNSNSQSSPQSSIGGASAGGKSASSFDGFSNSDKDGVRSDSNDAGGGSLPRGVFQNVRITADTRNNSIVVYSNQDDYRVIERSIRELDRDQAQVAIEATIAEVTLTDALQYGVQYYLESNDVGAGVNNGSISLSTSTTSALISQALPGLNVLLGSQASPKVVLSALSRLTSVQVLSAPSLVVADNQPAFLQVGDSVPVSTGSATVLSSSNTVVNTITMQDTGVILKVWPHIHSNGAVELEIEQEVSSVVGGTSSTTTNLNPTISQRRIHSTVTVPSGQTALLGGLMSETANKTQSGVPGLRQIQGLGDLFGTTDGSKARTEIIVFVKPTVIQNGVDAQNVAEAFRAGLSTMHSNFSIVGGKDSGSRQSTAIVTK
jgi:general secretion pathway protein D